MSFVSPPVCASPKQIALCTSECDLQFIESEQGFLVVAATRDIRTLKGIVSRLKKPVTIEDMNSATAKMCRMPGNRSARA